ncbi:kinase-like domain-containing protein, partial [Podospora aff. communis PSN243]
MAQPQPAAPIQAPVSPTGSQGQMQQSLWRRFFGRDKDNGNHGSTDASSKGPGSEQQEDRAGIIRRVSRKVVPGLPRAQTFKRQQSELRDKLEPVKQTPAERRAVSVDRRVHASISAFSQSNPRTSAPDFLSRTYSATASVPSLPASPTGETMEPMLGSIGEMNGAHGVDGEAADAAVDDCLDHPVPEHLEAHIGDDDNHSMTTSQYDNMIHDELESIWILNLSMHFRDKSKREKFFVTYRQHNTLWRRVTVSLDYRNAPENSLELDLVQTKFQRDKSAKIYEAIRESLHDIQFYDTVTNLKLQTTEGRLHVHVVEDVNEIICYPTVRMIQHMKCRRVKERELEFDSHLSGFVYKVRVNGEVLIKKEIPGPDTVDEFLYEINALNRLRFAENVIQFYGVVVDDKEENIKGLLISYADQGALIDIIYDHNHSLPWSTREKWARQIVNGLAEIHEAGFVQGDFTLSNIVINDEGDAKIIDINRRGCPVGWEPPEATPLIESNQRISMYIGVKSDLFQLGMVLWALATQEDEPEAHGRPLRIAADVQVPHWFRQIVSICLSEDPRRRLQALQLASLFPDPREDSQYGPLNGSAVSVDDRYSHQEFGVDSYTADGSRLRPGEQGNHWSYMGWGSPPPPAQEDLYYYPQRGRSPPSPMPSNHGEPSRYGTHLRPWSEKHHAALTAPSVSDVSPSE